MFDEVLVFTFVRFFCNLIYTETYRAMQKLIFSLLTVARVMAYPCIFFCPGWGR